MLCGLKLIQFWVVGSSLREKYENYEYESEYRYRYIVLTAVWLTPGGSSTVHIYTQTVHRTTQLRTLFGRLSEI